MHANYACYVGFRTELEATNREKNKNMGINYSLYLLCFTFVNFFVGTELKVIESVSKLDDLYQKVI